MTNDGDNRGTAAGWARTPDSVPAQKFVFVRATASNSTEFATLTDRGDGHSSVAHPPTFVHGPL